MVATYNDPSLTYSEPGTLYGRPRITYSDPGTLYNSPEVQYDGLFLGAEGAEVEMLLEVAASGISARSGASDATFAMVVPDPTGTKFEFPSGTSGASFAVAVSAAGGKTLTGTSAVSLALAVADAGHKNGMGTLALDVDLALEGNSGGSQRHGIGAISMALAVAPEGVQPSIGGYVALSDALSGRVTVRDEPQ